MEKDGSSLIKVSKVGNVMLLVGAACLCVVVLAFVATAVYELIKPPTDMHLPGLISAMLMFYLAPVGGILLILGGVLRFGALIILRRNAKKNGS